MAKETLERYLRRQLDNIEKQHCYSVGTETLRAMIDQYNEQYEYARCPECFEKVTQYELNMFGGLCEECAEPFDD